MKKQILREKIKEKRNLVSKEFVRKISFEIRNRILKSDLYKKASVIALYMPIKNEVELDLIIKDAFRDKKRVLVPVTKGEDVYFCEIFAGSEFDTESFGILVPKKKVKRENTLPDLIFVPGIAFDRCGNRLGWGKGFYDKLLKNTTSKKVGVCYDFQVTDRIESESHDIKMDYIITESELINCGEGL